MTETTASALALAHQRLPGVRRSMSRDDPNYAATVAALDDLAQALSGIAAAHHLKDPA